MKTEFEFNIARIEGPCAVTVSVAPDPNGNPSFEILASDSRGDYVETREDEDCEIIDKAIEKWGSAYADIFGDRNSDAEIRARVDSVVGFFGGAFDDVTPNARLILAQRFEEWRAHDKLAALLRAVAPKRTDDEPDYDAPKPLTPLENWQRNDEHNVQ